MKIVRLLLIKSIFVLLTVMCYSDEAKAPSSAAKAVVILNPTVGNTVHGNLQFITIAGGVQVTGDIEGLTPGKHGFHIHEKGDCSSADGTSAGGHFNPTGMPHAGPMEDHRHRGDMGNIIADEKGIAHVDYVDATISLSGDHSIIGRGVIVHAQEDDFKTQPTGNAGARVACGSIEAVLG